MLTYKGLFVFLEKISVPFTCAVLYHLRYSQMLISHEKSDQGLEPNLATILSRSEIDRPRMKSDRMTGKKRSIKMRSNHPLNESEELKSNFSRFRNHNRKIITTRMNTTVRM